MHAKPWAGIPVRLPTLAREIFGGLGTAPWGTWSISREQPPTSKAVISSMETERSV